MIQRRAKCGVDIDGSLALLNEHGYCSGNISDLCSTPVWDNSYTEICRVLSQPLQEDGVVKAQT